MTEKVLSEKDFDEIMALVVEYGKAKHQDGKEWSMETCDMSIATLQNVADALRVRTKF